MTRLIEDVLQQHADTAPAPQLDVTAIVAAGNRRVRRSRITTSLTAAAVATTVVASGLTLHGLLATPETDAATTANPFAERRVSWARGEVIHWGSETFAVGRTVSSYVQTDDGFVYTSPNGAVWLHDGTASRRLGQASTGRLRADDTGSLVAWVSAHEAGAPEYVVHDTALGQEVARVAGDSRAEVLAVDDGAVYWRDGADRMVRYDVASGETFVVHDQQPPAADPTRKEPAVYDLVDVADGQLAYVVDGGRGIETKVGPVVDVAAPTVARASSAFLSPDARFLAAEEFDNIRVYDVAARADVTPDLARYPFAAGYGWVDADTLMALGIEDLEATAYAIDLLTCEIPTGTCELVGETTLTEEQGLFALPLGDPLDS